MFEVVDKHGNIKQVYSVIKIGNIAEINMFLLYDEKSEKWIWENASEYKPLNHKVSRVATIADLDL